MKDLFFIKKKKEKKTVGFEFLIVVYMKEIPKEDHLSYVKV
jgi:hypothetical protein